MIHGIYGFYGNRIYGNLWFLWQSHSSEMTQGSKLVGFQDSQSLCSGPERKQGEAGAALQGSGSEKSGIYL